MHKTSDNDYFADLRYLVAERKLRKRPADKPLLDYISHLEDHIKEHEYRWLKMRERIAELENEVEAWKEGS